MHHQLLTDIIEAFKKFDLSTSTEKNAGLVDFSQWLQQHIQNERPKIEPNPFATAENELNIEISKLIIFLSRYARVLIKKAVTGFEELVSEDFTYLYALIDEKSLTKKELIEKNVHEKATGLEVIKRLLKHGLIEEKKDETDKRSKRVWLTEKGRKICFASFEQMNKVSTIVSGKLSQQEKIQMFTSLKKLEDFHSPIFLEERGLGLDELMGRLV
jgi:DNA-binding MarR family transcriptional regulator